MNNLMNTLNNWMLHLGTWMQGATVGMSQGASDGWIQQDQDPQFLAEDDDSWPPKYLDDPHLTDPAYSVFAQNFHSDD